MITDIFNFLLLYQKNFYDLICFIFNNYWIIKYYLKIIPFFISNTIAASINKLFWNFPSEIVNLFFFVLPKGWFVVGSYLTLFRNTVAVFVADKQETARVQCEVTLWIPCSYLELHIPIAYPEIDILKRRSFSSFATFAWRNILIGPLCLE